MNFMNGRPNGYWYNVRKHFVNYAKYNVTLREHQEHVIYTHKDFKVTPYILSILGTSLGEQKLIYNENINYATNSKACYFRTQNAEIEFNVVIERD